MSSNALPPYPAYKPTAIPWLQQVPEHWGEMKVKYIFRERVQKGYPNEPLLAATQSKGVVTKEAYGLRTVEAQKDLHLLKLVEKGDFVISLRSFQGGIEVSYARGIISPAYTILRTARPCDPGYLKFLLKSAPFVDGLKLFITGIREGQNIDYVRLARTPLPWPSVTEQHLVVRYLHALDAKVKRYIRAKRSLIARLQEQKQAIIQRAVTRGLDPNVKLKPSGVEWLGEVPEHWQVRPLRHYGWCQNGISKGAEYFGSGYPFVNYGDVYKSDALPTTVEGRAKSTVADRELFSVQQGDVLFTRTSETVDEIGFASTCMESIQDATFSGFVIRVRPFRKVMLPAFSKYYFRSRIHRDFFAAEMNLVTRASLGQDLLKRMPVLLPPMEEQVAICVFLDRETLILDKTIERESRAISHMLEYHTRLIADVVTGAVDVREAAGKLPEEDQMIGGAGNLLIEEETVEPELNEQEE